MASFWDGIANAALFHCSDLACGIAFSETIIVYGETLTIRDKNWEYEEEYNDEYDWKRLRSFELNELHFQNFELNICKEFFCVFFTQCNPMRLIDNVIMLWKID